MQHVDAGALLEHLDAELVLAAVAARSVGERRLCLARILDELRKGVHRERRIDREEELVGRHARDRHQVPEWIEAHLGIDVRVDGDQAVGTEQQGVAIGRRLRHLVAGDVAVGAGAVFHHHRLAQALGELLRQQAGGDVGGAARRDRHHDLDRILGKRSRRGR